MKTTRKPGWYWVKTKSGNWVVREYDGENWLVPKMYSSDNRDNYYYTEINEVAIIKP